MPVTKKGNGKRGRPTVDPDPWDGVRTRGIVFTNFGKKIEALPEDVKYLAYGDEKCPKTGRDHQQGFAYSSLAQRFSWWTKKFEKMHIEIMKGTFAQNEAYCSKEGKYTTLGEKPMENGCSKKKHDVVVLMEEGMRPTKIGRTYGHLYEFLARTERFSDRIWNEIQMEKMNQEGFVQKQVYILQGACGKGKTRMPHDEWGYGNVYRAVTNSAKWFDGYIGQDAVLFDECGPDNIMPITSLLQLTDGYPLQVPVKGGFVPFRPKAIYFSSNVEWQHWWKNPHQEHLQAMRRRITELRLFKADGTMEVR